MGKVDNSDFEKTAVRISNVSIVCNTILSAVKFLAGIFAHSSAMISDAVHSASDVFSSIIVIIGVKLASKKSDREHPYGHERLECAAAVILASVLGATGFLIGYNSVMSLLHGIDSNHIPGIIALYTALFSILGKEAMYHYTRHYAVKIDSTVLMADAWHHRSDAFSSVGSLAGILGSRMGIYWADQAANLIICVFIIKAAVDIFMDAVNKMVDHSCTDEVELNIIECALKNRDVLKVSSIYTREFGNRVYVEIEIIADGRMSLYKSSVIAEDIHDRIESEFPKIKHITVVMRSEDIGNL